MGVNMFYLRRELLVEFLRNQTGFTFTEEQVKHLMPTYEAIYRRVPPLHVESYDKFWSGLKNQKWHYVHPNGTLGPLQLFNAIP